MKSRAHPQPQPIEAVVFDIGKVLLDYDFDLAMHAASKLSRIEAPEIRRRLLTAHNFLEFERGRISQAEFHLHIQAVLNHPLPFDTFCEIWNGIFTGEIEPTITIFQSLKKRNDLKVGVLSNTNVIHFEWVLRRMPALS